MPDVSPQSPDHIPLEPYPICGCLLEDKLEAYNGSDTCGCLPITELDLHVEVSKMKIAPIPTRIPFLDRDNDIPLDD